MQDEKVLSFIWDDFTQSAYSMKFNSRSHFLSCFLFLVFLCLLRLLLFFLVFTSFFSKSLSPMFPFSFSFLKSESPFTLPFRCPLQLPFWKPVSFSFKLSLFLPYVNDISTAGIRGQTLFFPVIEIYSKCTLSSFKLSYTDKNLLNHKL